MWNLDDPKQAEAALQYLYSLPDDEVNSEAEQDEDAVEELGELHPESTTTEFCEPVTQFLTVEEVPEQYNINESDDDISDEECWGLNTNQFDNIIVNMDKSSKCTAITDRNLKEIDYFDMIFRDIYQVIVDETNRYATQNIRRRGNTYEGPSKNWEVTDIQEIRSLLGMLIMMGIHILPQL